MCAETANRQIDERQFVGNRGQIGIGVYDGLTALIAERTGADFLWLGSFSISAAMGLPDAGLVDATQLRDVVRIVRRCSSLPIVVDLESGFGDPLRVYHVCRDMFLAGASAVCIEDKPLTRRSSLYRDYVHTVASPGEQVRRLEAATAARKSLSVGLVVARTEALVANLGVAEALQRAETYIGSGADAVLVQSVDTSGEQVKEFCAKWMSRSPLFVVPTMYPQVSPPHLFAYGASHVIYANQVLRAVHLAVVEACSELLESQDTSNVKMSSISDICREIETVH